MKGLRRGLSVLVSGFLLIGLITGIARSENIYVTPTGTGDGSVGRSTNLQNALDMALTATEGVTIFLQQGAYTATYDSYNSFVYAVTGTNTNAVILSGGWNLAFTFQSADNTLTVLDGQSAMRVLKVTGDGTGVNFIFTIENLTIQNGKTNTYTAFPGETGYGAGISAMNLDSAQLKIIIRDSQIINNATANGSSLAGGMYITCDYEIYDSTFSGNQTLYYGGAIFSSYASPYTTSLAPIIDGCTFDSNTTTGAGGAHLFSYVSPVITNSKFIGLGGTTSSDGSGIMAYTNSFLTLENCIFSGNVSKYWSGAIQFWNSSGNITNTLFVNNKAGASGDGAGGVMDIVWASGDTQPVVNITNCTFAGNRTLGYQQVGGAITLRQGAALNIVNSIFWDNGIIPINNDGNSSISITYSDVQGGAGGTTNINSDPLFVAPGGDYQLLKGSPCIDVGNNNASGLPSTDLAGNARIYKGVVDMGAYEHQPVEFIFPVDNYECTACSSYNNWWPIFQWDTDTDTLFKSIVLQFYSHADHTKMVKLTASAKAIKTKQLSITSTVWNKILLLPGTAGGKIDWLIIGTEGDKAKTQVKTAVRSMQVDPAFPVGDIAISPTGITGTTLPTLSWQNHCAAKFKVWFGSNQDFSSKTTKKTSLSFTVKSPNDNGGVFTKQLTSGQWTAIKKLVGTAQGATVYWYVESWDVLKRYTKTDTEEFTLN